MEGLKVVCPSCRRKEFVTTDKYNPDKAPNGGMIKWLGTYHIDFLCSSTTLASELICPSCQAQLAPSGRLTVIEPLQQQETVVEEDPDKDFICDICGKSFSNHFALNWHKRSHKNAVDSERVSAEVQQETDG